MFLKVLHEHKRPGGFYSSHGWDYTGIIREKIARYFKIDKLSAEEYALGMRAVYELEMDGYIMTDPTQMSDNFKILTDKGKEVVEQDLDDMKLPSINIDKILTRSDLRNKIHADFVEGDYESAVFKAFKLLEESVRSKADLPPEVIGADLMSKAFSPTKGLLKHKMVQTEAEAEAIHHLMRGGVMLFKNPVSHRTVEYEESEEVAHVLSFANLLLNIVDQCELKT
jgi:uncharacterized protein (TIGR02391 family)